MKILRKDDVGDFLSEMTKTARVFCPQAGEGTDIMLLPFGEGSFTGEIGRPAISARRILFPQSEPVLSFTGDAVFKITAPEKVLVFGVRPCDARAVAFTERFMGRDNMPDPHYSARRNETTLVVIACNEPPAPSCFCRDAGGKSYLDGGFDLQLFDPGDHYIAVSDSDEGDRLLENRFFKTADGDLKGRVAEIRRQCLGAAQETPGVEEAVGRLKGDGMDPEFWESLALRCIGCGGCVYVCPTCTCFNVYDTPSPGGYTRYRTWDACLLAGFTRETSGHNPRPTPGSRLARRHEHKLRFDLVNHDRIGCVGCGRCSDACPVGLGAAEIITAINREKYLS